MPGSNGTPLSQQGRYSSMLATKKMQMPQGTVGPPLDMRIIRVQDMAVAILNFELELRYAPMFRMGYVQCDFSSRSLQPEVMHMSPDTASWLHGLENKGGKQWGLVANALKALVTECDDDEKNQSADLSQVVKPIRDSSRRPVRQTDDRVAKVCEGIAAMVQVMAPMCDGRALDPAFVADTVERYSALRDEMRSLREAMAQADGQFEVAQQYLIKMMEAE